MPNEQKVTRKLRAILSADVKGYSILMADDEVATIQTLKNYRNIMSVYIGQHGGRVVDAVGDTLCQRNQKSNTSQRKSLVQM
jgi:class 3 adenylate cyclase